MARARMIKPDFFRDEELAELPFEDRLLFAGLWTIADRKGRMEYRPKRIKADIFPYDNVDIEASLKRLSDSDFIECYAVSGSKYIQINAFEKHQHPHPKEPDSEFPSVPRKEISKHVLPRQDNVLPPAKTSESESLTESESLSPPPPAGAGQPSMTLEPVRERKRDAVWDAVAEIWFGGNVAKPLVKRVGKLTSAFKTFDATPEEIRLRLERYRRTWANVEATPEALIKHWCRFATTGPPGFAAPNDDANDTHTPEELDAILPD